MNASPPSANGDDSLVDLIYDAAFDTSLWRAVLEQIADRAHAQPANFLQINVVSGQGFGITARVPEETADLFFSEWSRQNPIGLTDDPFAYRIGWAPRITRDSDSVDRATLEQTPYWNEFLAPIDAHHSIALRLALRGDDLTSIGLARPSRLGPFEDAEIAALAPLHRHLIRAERMWRTLGVRQTELDQLDTLLAISSDALFFLDDRLALLRWTNAGDALLQRGALRLKENKLRSVEPSADIALQRALAAALAGETPLPVTLPAARPADALSVSIARLGARAVAGLTGARCLLVSVRPVARPGSAAFLRAIYGLTAAEAELALALAAGDNLRTVATRRDVSINTVRNQLAGVFDKTGCRRQQDLVRLMTTGHG